MKRLIALISLLACTSVFSATPTCSEHSGGNFCQYSGPVERIYVNSGNMILMYFDSAIDTSIPQSLGMDINYGNATAINIQDNPDFANYFYSTALAAQASGRNVVIQMRGTRHGYLKVDRIWLSKL